MNAASTDPTGAGTIVLIHGLWMTPRSWEHWAERYRSKGYTVLTPAWPGMEVEVEALNADPSPLETLDVETIVDHYEELIRELDSPPIIMGHSFGGGFTQILLDRGVGAAGVGVAPATVKGVYDLPLSTIRSSAPLLSHPFRKYGGLNEKQFHYAFANTLEPGGVGRDPRALRRAGADRGPERGRVRELHAPRGDVGGLQERDPARRCSSSRSRTTTSSRRRSPATTRRSTRRSRSSSRSSRAGRTSRVHPAGKRSPTTPSTGQRPTQLRLEFRLLQR